MKPAWSERKLDQKRAVYGAFKTNDTEFKSRNTRLATLERGTARRVTTLVMQELEKPRETHLFIKGDFTRPADKVAPGVPEVLHPLNGARTSTSASSNKTDRADADVRAPTRLDLARWVVDPANPLTARVTVNRVWQQYFGRGLVETENDFGTQGSAPTHPELLDWLACELMKVEGRMTNDERSSNSKNPDNATPGSSRNSDLVLPSSLDIRHSSFSPWSLKRLHRLIVTSATYRQSSRVRPELATIDPLNKLLARQSRLRLDAEVIRDSALFTSGLLSPKLGGPPVYPPQPDGVMTLGQSKRDWKASAGADRYRRALYTHFWRATPHPALAVFDAPDGFSACTRRLRSNTPLQALTLLNDQQFYEFAEALAVRVWKSPAKDDAERIDRAFRLCLSRAPGKIEEQRLQHLVTQQIAQEQGDETTRRQEAWKTMARVLLNLDETITRE